MIIPCVRYICTECGMEYDYERKHCTCRIDTNLNDEENERLRIYAESLFSKTKEEIREIILSKIRTVCHERACKRFVLFGLGKNGTQILEDINKLIKKLELEIEIAQKIKDKV